MASRAATARRMRHLLALSLPTARVLTWRPLFWSIVGASAYLVVGNPAGLETRLAIAGAAVGATSGFLLDDPAAVTLAATPAPLPMRTLHRVTMATVSIGLWWIGAASFVSVRSGGFPLVGRSLELAALSAIALATSAFAATSGDKTSGGIAGAVAALCCYAATFLPPQPWLPLPSNPDDPGASFRLTTAVLVAVAALWFMSRDPARRKMLLHVNRSGQSRRQPE